MFEYPNLDGGCYLLFYTDFAHMNDDYYGRWFGSLQCPVGTRCPSGTEPSFKVTGGYEAFVHRQPSMKYVRK